jgi:hypothetical protein
MRNYIKLRGIHWLATENNINPVHTLDAWEIAVNDGELMTRVQVANDRIIANNNPAMIWEFTYPNKVQDIYFQLDQRNLCSLFQSSPGFFFTNLQPNGSDDPATANLPNLAVFNRSPRSTFPSDLGTDGQRLRHGKAKTAGAALNYIGKLFFLTSNKAFLSLFNQLKAGKISAKDALAAANKLANLR